MWYTERMIFRDDKPLWLPEGSVRSILALTLTGAAIVASFVEALPQEFLWPAALTVNAFYFGSAPGRKGGDERD